MARGMTSSLSFCCLFLTFFSAIVAQQYKPTWDSLDKRPLPAWYDESKFGIFISWGMFSVPSFGNEWFWYRYKQGVPEYVEFMNKSYPPNWQYADFAPLLKAEMFDPDHWADVIQRSGAKYIALISKFHDGWCNWQTQTSWNWNSVDTGPHRDIVGDLAKAIQNTSVHFGVYFSQFEWFNPLFLQDQANEFKTQIYPKEVSQPQLYELVNMYKPDLIFSDGDWSASDVYWNSTNFLAWLYNESPVKDTVVVNDRWGKDCSCHHGGYYNCKDRFQPGTLQTHKWENAFTIDKKSWGFRREATLSDYLTMDELIKDLAITVSCGGNWMANIGPSHDGRIGRIYEERLLQIGEWLGINGEAIYSTTPWSHQNDSLNSNVWYTYSPSNKAVYGIAVQYPSDYVLTINDVKPDTSTTKVTLLGYGEIKWTYSAPKMSIMMPRLPLDSNLRWSWVIRFDGISSSSYTSTMNQRPRL